MASGGDQLAPGHPRVKSLGLTESLEVGYRLHHGGKRCWPASEGDLALSCSLAGISASKAISAAGLGGP